MTSTLNLQPSALSPAVADLILVRSMRTLILSVLIAGLRVSARAQPCGNDATPEQLAKIVQEALQQKQPLAGEGLVVPTAEVAQVIHRAVAGAVFGYKEIERQRPFKAVRS